MRAVGFGGVFAAAAVLLVALYARGVYAAHLEHGTLGRGTFLILVRFLVVDVLVLGAVIVLTWNRQLWTRTASCGVVLVFTTIQFAQYRSAASSGSFLTPMFLRMAPLVEDALTPRVATALVVSLLALLLALLVAARSLGASDLPRSARFRCALLLAAAAAVIGSVPAGDQQRSVLARHGLSARSPVVDLVRSLGSVLSAVAPDSRPLDESDLDVARSYGLSIDPGRVAPVVRPRVWRDPLPFATKGSVTNPNIIVVFVESLSAHLIEPYGVPVPGLTPHITEFARHAMRVDGYLNHTTPTVKGLRGQICSMFTGISGDEWFEAPFKPGLARLNCMPHVLKRRGYRAVHLSHAHPWKFYHEAQYVDFGYDETHFRKDVNDRFLGGEPFARKNWAGLGEPSDHQMFRALVAFLEHWPRKTPLFVSVSTIETHFDQDVGNDGVTFGDGSNRLLNTIHNLDHAFGEFWSWFRGSPYFGNTVVVLTADHAMLPNDEYRKIAGASTPDFSLSPIALIIHDPTHDLPASFRADTSSVDLAPSLLQLLGQDNGPCAFVGLSMFADRRRFLGGFGEDEDQALLFWDDDTPRVVRPGSLACDVDGPAPSPPCSVRRVIRFLKDLERSNRIWRE